MIELSICTTLKNRFVFSYKDNIHYLFPKYIESILNSVKEHIIEIVISDWQSTDCDIYKWMEINVPSNISVIIANIKGAGFSRGKGRNIAAKLATCNNILFSDADMILNADVIDYGIKCCNQNEIYYPTVKYEIEDGGKQIIHEGGGNLFITKELFYSVGGWPEFWSYGFEDTELCKALKNKYKIITNNNFYILHQWHPQDIEWKDKYANNIDPNVKIVKSEAQIAENEIVDNLKKHIKIKLNDPNVIQFK